MIVVTMCSFVSESSPPAACECSSSCRSECDASMQDEYRLMSCDEIINGSVSSLWFGLFRLFCNFWSVCVARLCYIVCVLVCVCVCV